jgi:hypothetical protein
MLQQTYQPALVRPSEDDLTAAAWRWTSALRSAQAGADAYSYGCVVSLLAEQFTPVTTIRVLLRLSVSPNPALMQRVVGLCEVSGGELDPHVALDAACALRLRQLLDGVPA